MASQAKMTIRVTSSRGASTVSYSTNGRYVSFNAAGLNEQLLQQPIQPTTGLSAFWTSVLEIVQASVDPPP